MMSDRQKNMSMVAVYSWQAVFGLFILAYFVLFTTLSANATTVPCTTNAECSNGCEVCTAGSCTTTNVADGTACGSSTDNACTDPDTCSNGNCVANNAANNTPCETDGNECTTDQCNSSGVCQHTNVPNNTACTPDTNECTNDVCTSGTCTHPNVNPNTPCTSDNVFCNGAERCQAGSCVVGDGPDPCQEDSLTCTTITCNEGTDMCDTAISSQTCLVGGVCFNEGDDNPSNECQECVTATSNIAFTDKQDNTACTTDGNECTNDVCTTGTCTHSSVLDNTACTPDSEECTNDVCTTGTCTHPSVPDNTACTSDSEECTNDVCTAGTCTHPSVPDNTACTPDSEECTNDVCTAGTCTHPNAQDNTACTPASEECTNDVCTAGTCTHPNAQDGAACNDTDGDECTLAGCVAGVCNQEFDQCSVGWEACRNVIFWANHAGQINGIPNVALSLIQNADGGCIQVCGETIDDTDLKSASSAEEALCTPLLVLNKRHVLVRELTAAMLNCLASGQDPYCYELITECDEVCMTQSSTINEIKGCITALNDLNNGRSDLGLDCNKEPLPGYPTDPRPGSIYKCSLALFTPCTVISPTKFLGEILCTPGTNNPD